MPLSNPTSSKFATHPASFTLLVIVCFFFSGVAALIYEVVWARQLSLFLGITSYAHTAVITAYMAGLAAGSLYFGRRSDRHPQPLKLYAWLEIGVAVYAAMTPWLFTFLQVAYLTVGDISQIGEMSGHLSRFSIALLALLIPTFLMGGTLPLLVRGFITELPELGKIASRFYGINTLGAMLGTLLAGYLLLPVLGITATIFVGVTTNLGIAVAVLTMLHRLGGTHAASKPAAVVVKQKQAMPEEAMSVGLRYIIFIGFATAGFAALLTQLAWIRALILVVGGSVYAFTITLASFLSGIGLGSLLYTRYLANPRGWLVSSWLQERMVQATMLALLISLTLLLGLPLIGKLPEWFLAGYAAGLHNSFPLFQMFIFALGFSVMILPSLFMGALFPLVTVIWTRSFGQAGQSVGAAYAINTTGTILGALLGGLFILPWLGVHYSIQLAAALYLAVATAFWLSSRVDLRQVYRYGIAGLAALTFMMTAWLIPPWNKILMVSGVFQTPDTIIKQLSNASLQQIVEKNELLYYKDGLDGTVAVRRQGNNRSLIINGKTDASSSDDLPTQVLLAQLPLALDRTVKSALVVGLGSGITAGSLAGSESLNSMTILEISREVIEASDFFKPENHGVLDDPRVELVTADARNFLMASSQRYDLIISEPSNPWITGVSNLFTDEFFKLAKSRLTPGGVMTQWFHTYGMSNTDLKIVLKTFDDNFEHVSVWSPVFEDLILIGSDEPHKITPAYDHNAEELNRVRVNSDRDLVRLYVFGADLLSKYVEGSKINSDNNPLIEFSAPRNLYSSTSRQNMADIFEYLAGRKLAVPVTAMVQQTDASLDANFMNLRIANNEGVTPNQVSPQWLVVQSLLGDRGNRTYGVVESERTLSWREDSARFYIKAHWHESVSRKNSLPSLLKKMTRSSARQGGNIKLPGGIDAIWSMSGGGGDTQLQLDIAWYCQAQPAGYTRYAVHAGVPDPGQDMWRNTLDNLASRFRCY